MSTRSQPMVSNRLRELISEKIIISILVSALVSGIISYHFAKKIDERSANREFIFSYSRTFIDNEKYRDISIALEEQFLNNKGLIMKRYGGQFSDYEIDDYLNFFYELYSYGEDSLVRYSVIDNQFNYYFCITYKNNEINKYRQQLSTEEFTAFDFLDDLAKKFNIDESDECNNLLE